MGKLAIGSGASGAIAGKLSTKIWDGKSKTGSPGHVVGYGQTGVSVKNNHGGIQKASGKSVKYKGVSSGYC